MYMYILQISVAKLIENYTHIPSAATSLYRCNLHGNFHFMKFAKYTPLENNPLDGIYVTESGKI